MAATDTFGTTFQVEDTPAAGTFTTIPGLLEMDPPGTEVDTADVTQYDSTNGYDQHLPTRRRLSAMTAQFAYDSAEALHLRMESDAAAGTSRLYRINYQDTGTKTVDFNAFVTRTKPGTAKDNANVLDVTFQPSGGFA